MTASLRIYINGAAVDVESGSDVRAALEAHDPALATRYRAGHALITDARGIELAGDEPLSAGSILRVVVRSPRGPGGIDAES